jgi:hypothetical protein
MPNHWAIPVLINVTAREDRLLSGVAFGLPLSRRRGAMVRYEGGWPKRRAARVIPLFPSAI